MDPPGFIIDLPFSKVGGHLRRSVGPAFQVAFGNTAAPISTFSVLAGDGPKYIRAYSLSLGFFGFAAIFCTLYLFILISENRKRAQA